MQGQKPCDGFNAFYSLLVLDYLSTLNGFQSGSTTYILHLEHFARNDRSCFTGKDITLPGMMILLFRTSCLNTVLPHLGQVWFLKLTPILKLPLARRHPTGPGKPCQAKNT